MDEPTASLTSAEIDNLFRVIGRLKQSGVGGALCEAGNISREDAFHDVSITLHRGEIVSLAGMVGSGRTGVAGALAGIDPLDRGTLLLEGRPMQGAPLRRFIDRGVCFVPEDRDTVGLILSMSMSGNTTIASPPKFSRGPLLNLREESKAILMVSSDLDELMNMCHRVAVMYKGRLAATLATARPTREEVLSLAIGKAGAGS